MASPEPWTDHATTPCSVLPEPSVAPAGVLATSGRYARLKVLAAVVATAGEAYRTRIRRVGREPGRVGAYSAVAAATPVFKSRMSWDARKY
jgi:hypothetical protein